MLRDFDAAGVRASVFQLWDRGFTNSHATFVLVWPGHESWENSHTNSRLSTLINSHATLVLVWPGHESWENSHTNSRLSTLINSYATLVLIWPGHESWEDFHKNSTKTSTLTSGIKQQWIGLEGLSDVFSSTISCPFIDQRYKCVPAQVTISPLKTQKETRYALL